MKYLEKMSKRIDLSGKKFGKLKVIREAGKIKRGFVWLCKCDCGNFKTLLGEYLRDGSSTHCGCSRRVKHGKYGTKVCHAWDRMIQRCNNPSCLAYVDYGGKRYHSLRYMVGF